MAERTYPYVIVGAGLTGGSAVEGIREIDKNGPILLIGEEKHLPYDRPDLTKKLWFGKKTLDQVFVHDRDYYLKNGVDLALGDRVVALDAKQKTVVDSSGETYHYEKLLLATGGIPRSLPVPGSDLEGICYYRYLDDYIRIRAEATRRQVGAGHRRRLHRLGDRRSAQHARRQRDDGLPDALSLRPRLPALPGSGDSGALPRARHHRPDGRRAGRLREEGRTLRDDDARGADYRVGHADRRRRHHAGDAARAGRGAGSDERHRRRRVPANVIARTSTPPATTPSSPIRRWVGRCASSTGTTR